MTDPQGIRISIQRFPVAVWDASRKHSEALLREFAFIAAASESDTADVPRRLLDLVDRLRARYGSLSSVEERLEQALARGVAEIDLVLLVPLDARSAALDLRAMLDEADAFCRNGDLLTLASVDELREFREWYLGEVVRQVDGADPIPWPDWKPDVTR